MAASSVGSDVFFVFALLAICLLVLLLLRYYLPLRSTPAYLLVPVFLAIALPSSIILLVPIDLASSSGTDTEGSRGIWLPQRLMLVSWRISYWLTFLLTWFMLPLLGEYCDSGYREPKDRFLYSLRSNARYQLTVLGCGILGAVYFILQNGFHYESLKALVMSLAYAWGLVFAIYLMGHGLVALPRRIWRHASVSGRLRRLQSTAPKLHDRMEDAIDELDQYENQVLQLRQRKTGTARDFQEWIDELVEASNLPESRPTTTTGLPQRGAAIPPVITERYLADLTRKLKRARHARARFTSEWTRLCSKAVGAQAILDSHTTQRLEFPSTKLPSSTPRVPSFLSNLTLLTPFTRYILHAHFIPYSCYASAIVLSLCSATLIWSEIVRALDPKLSVVGLTVIHHPGSDRGQIGFAGQCIAGAWICYMCLAALYSVTEVKIWGNRALVRRGTYEESATWYAGQVAKLTVPLSYNFVTFVPPSIEKETTFYAFLGKLIDLTSIGNGFSDYFPIFILVPVCATLFNLYGKVKNVFGFGGDIMLDDEDENVEGYGTGSWREGRALIEREVSGHSGNTVGLTHRDNSPPNAAAASRYRDNPAVGASTVAAADRARAPREPRRRLIDTDDDDGDNLSGGESWWGGFTHRVKNTFDTIERPSWLPGGDDGPSSSGTGYSRAHGAGSTNDGGNSDWKRWFGGRNEGRVRL